MHISVRIQDKWYLYVNVISSINEIPSVVANFKAEAIDIEEETGVLLVKVTEIPEEFGYIFGDKETDRIKPISLSPEKLFIAEEDRDAVLKDIKGKTVRVWFDGSLIHGDGVPEMSYPLWLGEVYRIVVED